MIKWVKRRWVRRDKILKLQLDITFVSLVPTLIYTRMSRYVFDVIQILYLYICYIKLIAGGVRTNMGNTLWLSVPAKVSRIGRLCSTMLSIELVVARSANTFSYWYWNETIPQWMAQSSAHIGFIIRPDQVLPLADIVSRRNLCTQRLSAYLMYFPF